MKLKVVFYFALIWLVFLILLNGWVTEDAYITPRVVDNFVHGFGPRWNISERVQVFTHPLWFFVLSFGYFFTREAYLTTLLIGFALSLGTLWVLCNRSRLSNGDLVIALGLLIGSGSFLSYSTSGLENPLCHILLLIYAVHIRLISSENKGASVALLSLCAGLLGMTRLDLMLLVGPVLLYLTMKNPRVHFKHILLGFSPLLAWELFSLFYYGSFFPNTAYAKLFSIGVPRSHLFVLGLRYLKVNLIQDPITLTVTLIAMIKCILHRSYERRFLGIGILLQVLYIISVGGDYMVAGRFLSSAFVFSLPFAVEEVAGSLRHQRLVMLWAAALLALVGFHSLRINELQWTDLAMQGSAHLRSFNPALVGLWQDRIQSRIDKLHQDVHHLDLDRIPIFKDNSFEYLCLLGAPFIEQTLSQKDEILISANGSRYSDVGEQRMPFYRRWRSCEPSFEWRFEGENAALYGMNPIYNDDIGLFGYYAGPKAYIVDDFGLSHAFLARLPAVKENFEIGHFYRLPPLGFKESIEQHRNLLVEPKLARLYDLTQDVTQGDLWNWHRLASIFELNVNKSFYLSTYETTPSVAEHDLTKTSTSLGSNGIIISLDGGISAGQKADVEVEFDIKPNQPDPEFSITYFSMGFRHQYTQRVRMNALLKNIIEVPVFVTDLSKQLIELNPLLQKNEIRRTSYQITHVLLRPESNLSFKIRSFKFKASSTSLDNPRCP